MPFNEAECIKMIGNKQTLPKIPMSNFNKLMNVSLKKKLSLFNQERYIKL